MEPVGAHDVGLFDRIMGTRAPQRLLETQKESGREGIHFRTGTYSNAKQRASRKQQQSYSELMVHRKQMKRDLWSQQPDLYTPTRCPQPAYFAPSYIPMGGDVHRFDGWGGTHQQAAAHRSHRSASAGSVRTRVFEGAGFPNGHLYAEGRQRRDPARYGRSNVPGRRSSIEIGIHSWADGERRQKPSRSMRQLARSQQQDPVQIPAEIAAYVGGLLRQDGTQNMSLSRHSLVHGHGNDVTSELLPNIQAHPPHSNHQLYGSPPVRSETFQRPPQTSESGATTRHLHGQNLEDGDQSRRLSQTERSDPVLVQETVIEQQVVACENVHADANRGTGTEDLHSPEKLREGSGQHPSQISDQPGDPRDYGDRKVLENFEEREDKEIAVRAPLQSTIESQDWKNQDSQGSRAGGAMKSSTQDAGEPAPIGDQQGASDSYHTIKNRLKSLEIAEDLGSVASTLPVYTPMNEIATKKVTSTYSSSDAREIGSTGTPIVAGSTSDSAEKSKPAELSDSVGEHQNSIQASPAVITSLSREPARMSNFRQRHTHSEVSLKRPIESSKSPSNSATVHPHALSESSNASEAKSVPPVKVDIPISQPFKPTVPVSPSKSPLSPSSPSGLGISKSPLVRRRLLLQEKGDKIAGSETPIADISRRLHQSTKFSPSINASEQEMGALANSTGSGAAFTVLSGDVEDQIDEQAGVETPSSPDQLSEASSISLPRISKNLELSNIGQNKPSLQEIVKEKYPSSSKGFSITVTAPGSSSLAPTEQTSPTILNPRRRRRSSVQSIGSGVMGPQASNTPSPTLDPRQRLLADRQAFREKEQGKRLGGNTSSKQKVEVMRQRRHSRNQQSLGLPEPAQKPPGRRRSMITVPPPVEVTSITQNTSDPDKPNIIRRKRAKSVTALPSEYSGVTNKEPVDLRETEKERQKFLQQFLTSLTLVPGKDEEKTTEEKSDLQEDSDSLPKEAEPRSTMDDTNYNQTPQTSPPENGTGDDFEDFDYQYTIGSRRGSLQGRRASITGLGMPASKGRRASIMQIDGPKILAATNVHLLGNLTVEERESIFDEYDYNKSGTLDRSCACPECEKRVTSFEDGIMLKLQPLIKTIVQLVIDGDLNRDVESLRKLYPTADYEQLKHIAIEERSQNSLFSSEEYRDDLMMGTETEFLRCIASVGGNSKSGPSKYDFVCAWNAFAQGFFN